MTAKGQDLTQMGDIAESGEKESTGRRASPVDLKIVTESCYKSLQVLQKAAQLI